MLEPNTGKVWRAVCKRENFGDCKRFGALSRMGGVGWDWGNIFSSFVFFAGYCLVGDEAER